MVVPTSTTFNDLPAFFEPNAPQPILPVLIAQTEVGKMCSPSKFLAQEQIGPSPTNSCSRFEPSPSGRPAFKHSGNQITGRQKTPGIATADDGPHGANSSGSEPLKTDSGDESDDSEEDLIPKPDGEAGRPGCGGYNLEEVLGWKKSEFKKLKILVKKPINDHLDPTRSYTSQSLASLIIVQNLVSESFPILHDYVKAWPVIDLLRLQLKYTSGRARSNTRQKLNDSLSK